MSSCFISFFFFFAENSRAASDERRTVKYTHTAQTAQNVCVLGCVFFHFIFIFIFICFAQEVLVSSLVQRDAA